MPLPSSLTPHVVVFATDDLAALLKSHGLPPIHHLLEHFTPLGPVITRTTTLVPVTHSSFSLRFSDLTQVESSCREDEEIRAGRTIDWVGGRIARKAPGWVEELESKKKGEPMMGDTKWWQELSDCVEGDRAPARGEGWNHPVALILATTTLASNPLQAVTNLHTRVVDFPPWVDTNILRYTLVIHPLQQSTLSLDETNALMNATKKQFGLHCHLLTLNLAKPDSPKPLRPKSPQLPPPAPFQGSPEKPKSNRAPATVNGVSEEILEVLNLSDEDTVNVTRFIREFVTQSLVPWMERCVLEWNEVYSSSRRLPSRLFSSTRRLFGSSSTPSASLSMSTPASPVSTTNGPFSSQPQGISPQRRLAEFSTFLGDIKLAVPLWESIRKEGKGGSDVLPMLLAPSLTLEAHAAYALAPLTTGSALGGKESVRVGAAAQLRALIYTIRWVRGVPDILELGGEKWLVWAAGTTEEAPMALLIAQAALMGLRKGLRRVAAMWYVLAANRLEKCGVKALTVYFLHRAHELYLLPHDKLLSPSFGDIEGKNHPNVGFDSILPSIEHSLGRLKYTTGDVAGAVELFLGLLKGSIFVHGVPHDGDKVFLDDFRVAFQHLQNISSDVVATKDWKLPVPISQAALTRRRFAAIHSKQGDLVDSDQATQHVLEELEDRWRSFWRSSGSGGGKEPLEKSGSGEVGERFWVDIVVRNPLDCELTLGDVTLQVREDGKDDGLPDCVEIEVVPEVTLGPKEQRTLSLYMSASRPISLEVTHLTFNFLSLLPIRESLGIRGRRLNDTIAQQRSVVYADDVFMRVDVKQSGGRLKTEVLRDKSLPKILGTGELRRVVIRVTNTGTTDVGEVWAVLGECGAGGSAWLDIHKRDPDSEQSLQEPTIKSNNKLLPPRPIPLPLEKLHGSLSVVPGESFDIPVIVQAHMLKPLELAVLFVFRQNAQSPVFFSSMARYTAEAESVVDVVVGVRPLASANAGYAMNLEVENVGGVGDIKILQVAALSPTWAWKRDVPEGTTSEISILPERQVTNMLATVTQVTESSMDAVDFLARRMDDVLQGNPIIKEGPPAAELHLSVLYEDKEGGLARPVLQHFVQATRRQRLSQSLLNQFPLIPPSDHPYIFPLYTPQDFEVIVSWAVPGQGRSGFTVVSGLTLGANRAALKEVVTKAETVLSGSAGKKGRSMYAETAREKEALVASVRNSPWNRDEDPFVVHVLAEDHVGHDFSKGPLRVPVEFSIRNTSTCQATEFTLLLGKDDRPARSKSNLPRYVGILTHRGTVPPSSAKSIRTKIWVGRPGVYSLGGWRVESRLAAASGTQTRSLSLFSQTAEDEKVIVVKDISPTTASS